MVNRRSEAIGLLTAFALIGSAGCDSSSPTATGGDAGTDSTILTDQKTANPPFDAAAFVAGIDHPYLPLVPGTVFHYRSETPDGLETNDVAEDMARVLSLKASPDVPYGSFDDCVGTMEWTPLEPGFREHKSYCAGVGLVLGDQPKGGHIRNELVSISHF
jgi:hypothetical protein